MLEGITYRFHTLYLITAFIARSNATAGAVTWQTTTSARQRSPAALLAQPLLKMDIGQLG